MIAGQRRWIVVDIDQNRYNAGLYTGEISLESIRDRIETWWQTKRDLGQRGVTAEKLRRWIVDGR